MSSARPKVAAALWRCGAVAQNAYARAKARHARSKTSLAEAAGDGKNNVRIRRKNNQDAGYRLGKPDFKREHNFYPVEKTDGHAKPVEKYDSTGNQRTLPNRSFRISHCWHLGKFLQS